MVPTSAEKRGTFVAGSLGGGKSRLKAVSLNVTSKAMSDLHMRIKWKWGNNKLTNLTFVPAISITRDCISLSVMRFMWPLRTYNQHQL